MPAERASEEPRLRVRKTYKLAIGGAFPRSESGRSYPVEDASGALLAHAAQASRKDVRDAVVAARKAFPGWWAATAYNRGQVLYRVAEMLDGRREQFASEVAAAEGVSADEALQSVDESIDRVVWYAGWADKFAQVAGSANPVAGPYFNFSLPEPTGVVAILAPQESSLLGFVSVLAPVLCTGNTGGHRRLPASAAARGLALRGARDLRSARRRRQRADGLHGRARALARESPRRQRDRPHRGCRRRPRRPAARRSRQRQARLRPGG